jgi:hypothetical protein
VPPFSSVLVSPLATSQQTVAPLPQRCSQVQKHQDVHQDIISLHQVGAQICVTVQHTITFRATPSLSHYRQTLILRFTEMGYNRSLRAICNFNAHGMLYCTIISSTAAREYGCARSNTEHFLQRMDRALDFKLSRFHSAGFLFASNYQILGVVKVTTF